MDSRDNITDADLRAADDLLSRISAGLSADIAARQGLRQSYATLHARFGADKFSLRFGFREPRTPLEELEVSFFKQEISEDEYKERFKQHATRPVDLPMLQKFFDEYEAAVEEYSDVLQLIVQIATDRRGEGNWKSREREVDVAVAKLDAKFDMFSTELMTVSKFLTEVQADREHSLKCGDYSGDSVHWIATLAFSYTSKAWTSCKDIAHRSRNDPNYLYSTTASSLFLKTWIETNKLPRPNDLAAMMRSERAKAFATFGKSNSARPTHGGLVRTVQPIHFEDFSGHQFERLVFAYHLRRENWRSLEWYGQGGSDLGRDIWGERDSGETLCIQCVNRKATTASKITADLDSIVSARGGAPSAVLAVCASSVSAKLRDKVKAHAAGKGIGRCDIWSGPEFEERLRHNAEALLKRFLGGEEFPDDPQQLRSFVSSEVGGDEVLIQRIRRVFDRPAFTTPFHRESSLPAFRQAIGDTIQALNTGIWQTRDGKEIERFPSRHQVSIAFLRSELAGIVDELTNLRAQFEQLLRSGEIRHCECNVPDCPTFFFSPAAVREMDRLRSSLMSHVRSLHKQAGPTGSAIH